MTKRIPKQHNLAVDLIRIIAILAVVAIHTSTRTLEAAQYDLKTFSMTLFFNQILRFAVPMFFMISGFVLELNYHHHESFIAYLKKRFNRILIPYIFWSLLYYFFIYTTHSVSFFRALLTGDSSYQLYFIPSLILFYLLFPLLHRWYIVISNKWVLSSIGITEIGLMTYDYYIHPLPLYYPVSIFVLNFFVFILGIFAAHHQDRIVSLTKQFRYIVFVMLFLLILSIFFEGKLFYEATHNYLAFYAQWRPDILVYTILLGSVLFMYFTKNELAHPIIHKLARLSFFVFFIHVMFLEFLWAHVFKPLFEIKLIFPQFLWFDVLFFFLVTICSFGLAYIVHKIPYASKITG